MDFRLEEILCYLDEIKFPLKKLSAVVGRGGIVVPVKSGAYKVNDLLVDRLKNRPLGNHASNLGGLLSYEIAKKAGVDAFVYDGVTVDELTDVARVTGLAAIERISRCHALNMRAVALKVAQKLNRPYKELNIIVTHMGGGITMSIHNHGRMADVVLDSEGPLSPERSGRLPATTLLKYLSRIKLIQKKL
jgi:butyrate kinase